ncbi:Putative zn(2)Cys(6) fungal-type DNA-binding domain-containing protein [Colletotrichum destructivum]|uniref:Zn(2)Cys(6) fungal-type DNA-binding domain-containing protein n=1 Tax=Colletotrichum destructivum TaxID=34406 RepID=A0AAX4IWH9_9PEZI|nr:Putative zn(2)Cys(6) fungal-type DNA-binding domain-containing protein [Colletotrichum destructivum]
MPSATKPCARCRERHEKCDDQLPSCGRCEKRGVECHRPEKRPSFRQGSTANYDGTFSRGQRWVNSRPRAFRFDSRAANPTATTTLIRDTNDDSPASNASSLPDTRVAATNAWHETVRNPSEVPDAAGHEAGLDGVLPLPTPAAKRRRTEPAPQEGEQFFPASPAASGASVVSPWSSTALPTAGITSLREDDIPIHSPQAVGHVGEQQQQQHFSPSAASYHTTTQHQDDLASIQTTQPTEGIQEACLLRYFVEEFSPWFDLCDDERHFQLVVSRRARHCQPLRDAVFAVAARHLCRHPKYRPDPGPGGGGGGVVVYQNQPLPDLTPQSAFEYMLRCIPALREVSRTRDEAYRENLAAAALILRQFEEMDPEEAPSMGGSSDWDAGGSCGGGGGGSVNFLDITKAILRAAPPSRWSGLLSAVYWVAVRQEIYFALTLGRSPQITARPDQGREVSFANRLVWFMSEVAKWKMGDRLETEWERLRSEEDALAHECSRQFIPITQRPADRSRGEIFPLTWYASDVEVTGLQHFILARMILVAEDPSLLRQGPNRRAHRDAEHQVRAMIMELCGLAMHHLRAPPNLTTAGMGIVLYGDYFNDPWEREALLGVLREWKAHHAWPVRKGFQALGAAG